MLKTIRQKKSAALCVPLGLLCAVGLFGAAPSHADLSYTLTTSITGGAGGGGQAFGGRTFTPPTIATTYYFKGDKERVDSSITSPMFSRKTATITDAATGKVVNIDSALKIYDVEDLSSVRPDLFGVAGAGGGFGRGAFGGRRGRRGQGGQGGGFGGANGQAGGAQGAAPDAAGGPGGGPGGPGGRRGGPEDRADETGTVTVAVSVVDRGEDQVGDVNTHHYSITTTESATGTVRVDTNPNTLDVWVDSTAPRPLSPAVKDALNGVTLPGAKVNYVYTGDVDLLKTALASVPVRIRIISQRGDTVEVDRTSQSTGKLSESLFTPPAADKEVTPTDYQTQERAAMRARFGGGRRGGGGGFGGQGGGGGYGGGQGGNGGGMPPAPNNQ